MNTVDNVTRWNAKHDVFRPVADYSDLLKIVACYYEMYSKASTFLGPWIAKQFGMTFLVPTKDQIKESLGKERPSITFRARNAFVEALTTFLVKYKGKKTLITPNPSSHHSAQFPSGTFSITEVTENRPVLRDEKVIRRESKTLHMIEFANAEAPVYVENLMIPPDQIGFVIVRPKLGKLGTPSTARWEVLLYKIPYGYLVDHTDSFLNPRYSGIL